MLSVFVSVLLVGDVTAPRTVEALTATRAAVPPTIDGHLDEPAWGRAPVTSDFLQREPLEGEAPTERTEVRILYDDRKLYVGVRLFDSDAAAIVARLGRRDQQTGSDTVYLCLDTFQDRRNAAIFALDAAGTILDGVMTNDNINDVNYSWDPVWEGVVSVDAQGWTAEMAIPFSQLRFRPETGAWGVDIRRDISRKSETDYVVFTPRRAAGFVSRFPRLEGIADVPAPALIELLPYVTLRAELLQPTSGDPFNQAFSARPNAGVDAKIGLKSDLTLDLAVNPDFGQVEVDPAVVNLSDIETFYEEKRPFFIEGANIYQFGKGGSVSQLNLNWDTPQLFYTRRLGRKPQGELPDVDFTKSPDVTRILGAAKLTGKLTDGLSIGTLHAVTNRETGFADVGGEHRRLEVEPYTYYGTLRLLDEVNAGRQGVGLMATAVARDLSDPALAAELVKDALALGVDGWAYLDADKEWVLSAWSAGSYVAGDAAAMTALQEDARHYLQRPDFHTLRLDPTRQSLAGYAGRLRLEKLAGDVRFYSALGVINPGFEANDLGYLTRTDVINSHVGVGYTWLNPTSFLRDALLLGLGATTLNFDGHVTWAGLVLLSDLTFANFDFLELLLARGPWDTLSTRLTRGGPMVLNRSPWSIASAYYQSDGRRRVVVTSADEVDWSPNGSFVHVDALVELRAFSGLSVSVGPAFEHTIDHTGWVGGFADPTAFSTFGNRYVFADLAQSTVFANIRVNCILSPKLSLQVYVQPFVSRGRYRSYKDLARPRTHSFNADAASAQADGTLMVDPDGAGPAAPFSFTNPDFSIKSVRGNAVLRWEYLPGSVLYLVWTQTRNRDDGSEAFGPLTAGREMFDTRSDNLFMAKLSYWWTP